MTASSQNPPGAQPTNPPYAVAAAVAQAAPVPPSRVQHAAGVFRAAMKNGRVTAEDLAQVAEDTGILFDPERAEEIASAARATERGKCAAELTAAAQDRQARDWFHARQRAVGQLCEGRPLEHLVEVGEVLAALDGRTPTDAPLTLTWDRSVDLPDGGSRDGRAIVPCTTARGGRAALVLSGEERLGLASLLDAEIVRDISAPCPTDGCGTVDDYDASDPSLFGWARVEVAGIADGHPRWYCSAPCVSNALARAGAELAEADQRAELDGGL